MLAVFAALAAEGRCLERFLEGRQRARLHEFPIVMGQYAGRPVLLCRTGIGGQRAEAAARTVLDRLSPLAVLSLGFAGAVEETLRGGDILICQRVYLGNGQETAAEESDGRLVGLAEAAAQLRGVPYQVGNSVTVPRLVGQPQEKRVLAKSLPVQVVEMESYWLAQAARERGVPFLALRAVVDGARDRLPEAFASVSDAGTIRWWPLLAYLGAHPGFLPQLSRLARNALRASRRLSALAGGFLELWSRET